MIAFSKICRSVFTSLLLLLCLALTGVAAIRVHTFISHAHRRQVNNPGPPIGADNLPSPENFRPIRAVNEQPLVSDFDLVSVQSATGKIRAEELVLGVVIDEHARAYPINMLTGPAREIINDEIGGHAIAATW